MNSVENGTSPQPRRLVDVISDIDAKIYPDLTAEDCRVRAGETLEQMGVLQDSVEIVGDNK